MTESSSRVSIGRTEHGLTTITAKFEGGAASFVIDQEMMTMEQLVQELRILADAIETNERK
jgi:hypothetical protein